MSGNTWEWTRTIWGKGYSKFDFKYPYKSKDGRERIANSKETKIVLRGGSFYNNISAFRCCTRDWYDTDFRDYDMGFRVVVSPFFSGL